jgi:hypothetical protein
VCSRCAGTYVEGHKSGFGGFRRPVNCDKCAERLRTSWLSDQGFLNGHVGDINEPLFDLRMIAVKQMLANTECNIGIDGLKEGQTGAFFARAGSRAQPGITYWRTERNTVNGMALDERV